MKTLLYIVVALVSVFLFSINKVYADIPYISNNTTESRTRIQNGDITCETSSPVPTLNVGIYGGNSEGGNRVYNESEKGGYVGISIPLGGNSNATDCNRLNELSIREKEAKLRQLEEQVKLMESRALKANQ